MKAMNKSPLSQVPLQSAVMSSDERYHVSAHHFCYLPSQCDTITVTTHLNKALAILPMPEEG